MGPAGPRAKDFEHVGGGGQEGEASKDYTKPRQTIQSPENNIQKHKTLDKTTKD